MSWTTADLCDHHGAGQRQIVPGAWRSFGAVKRFCGPITTLEANDCNAELRALLAEPGAGRVLVVDGGSHLGALLGDRLAALAAHNGWAGVVIAGSVRDSHALGAIELGVIATGTWPERSVNRAGGRLDVPLTLGGCHIEPGHWLYADEDGLLVCPQPLHHTD